VTVPNASAFSLLAVLKFGSADHFYVVHSIANSTSESPNTE